jgi:hypothetical protein
MKYDGDITYNQEHSQYNGLYVVSPQAFGLTPTFGNLNLLKVIVLKPPSITSTLVFVPSPSVIIPTGVIENSETSSSIDFSAFNGYGSIEFDKINADAYAISGSQGINPDSSGYVAISVDKNESYAFATADTIVFDKNSAGTIDVTIISNV